MLASTFLWELLAKLGPAGCRTEVAPQPPCCCPDLCCHLQCALGNCNYHCNRGWESTRTPGNFRIKPLQALEAGLAGQRAQLCLQLPAPHPRGLTTSRGVESLKFCTSIQHPSRRMHLDWKFDFSSVSFHVGLSPSCPQTWACIAELSTICLLAIYSFLRSTTVQYRC